MGSTCASALSGNVDLAENSVWKGPQSTHLEPVAGSSVGAGWEMGGESKV